MPERQGVPTKRSTRNTTAHWLRRHPPFLPSAAAAFRAFLPSAAAAFRHSSHLRLLHSGHSSHSRGCCGNPDPIPNIEPPPGHTRHHSSTAHHSRHCAAHRARHIHRIEPAPHHHPGAETPCCPRRAAHLRRADPSKTVRAERLLRHERRRTEEVVIEHFRASRRWSRRRAGAEEVEGAGRRNGAGAAAAGGTGAAAGRRAAERIPFSAVCRGDRGGGHQAAARSCAPARRSTCPPHV